MSSMINRAKKSKKQSESEDSYDPVLQNSIYSQEQDFEQHNKIKIPIREEYPSKKIQESQNNRFGKQNISMDQIKQVILSHTPDMEQRIKILDDNTLRQIYNEIFLQNSNSQRMEEQGQESKSNHNNNNNKSTIYEQIKYPFQSQTVKKRSSQIQIMINEILETVPTYKNEVESFDDEQIKELWLSIASAQSKDAYNRRSNAQTAKQQFSRQVPSYGQSNQTSITNNSNMSQMDVRKFIYQKIPQMRDQLQILSDQDLIEVYQQYIQNEKLSNQNTNNSLKNIKNDSRIPPNTQLNQIRYDPSNKLGFQSLLKAQPNLHLPSQNNSNWYNNNPYGGVPQNNSYQQYQSNKQLNRSSGINNGFSRNDVVPKGNLSQMNKFHNGQRVTNLPQNLSNCAKTVVIFHTFDPGYIPSTNKNSCKCPCCSKRQQQMYEPNALNSFLQELMSKYSLPRK